MSPVPARLRPRLLGAAIMACLVFAVLPAAWALRGRIYRQRGEMDRALADMQQALRYSPNAADVLMDAVTEDAAGSLRYTRDSKIEVGAEE